MTHAETYIYIDLLHWATGRISKVWNGMCNGMKCGYFVPFQTNSTRWKIIVSSCVLHPLQQSWKFPISRHYHPFHYISSPDISPSILHSFYTLSFSHLVSHLQPFATISSAVIIKNKVRTCVCCYASSHCLSVFTFPWSIWVLIM